MLNMIEYLWTRDIMDLIDGMTMVGVPVVVTKNVTDLVKVRKVTVKRKQ